MAALRQRSWCARILSNALLVVGVLLVAAWFGRAPLLRSAAHWWIVPSAPLVPADAVVVLGGGIEVRPFAAAEYYRKGLTRKVLISDVRQSRSERERIFPSQLDRNRTVLMKMGVPEDAIEAFGNANRNTYDEATALRQWADKTRARNFIVPTEIFSSPRVKWMMETALDGTGARLQVPAFDTEDYSRDDWWQRDLGLIAFQNEVLKYAYYRLKY